MCAKKYGEDWKEYKKIVRWRILPWVYWVHLDGQLSGFGPEGLYPAGSTKFWGGVNETS
jgi:hypothetical protein